MKYLPTLLLALVLSSCATFQGNAGKVLASTSQTVDAAMQSWAQYLKVNPLPPSRQYKVQKAYQNYQVSMAAAEKAYIALAKNGDKNGWQQASIALTASQAEIIAAITAITGKGTK